MSFRKLRTSIFSRRAWHFKPILCIQILRNYYFEEQTPLRRKSIQILLVQISYFLSFSPIVYNSRFKRFLVNKSSMSYPLFLILFLSITLALVMKQFYALITYGFHIQKLADALPWFFALSAYACSFLYVSSWLKNKEFTEFLNKYNIFADKVYQSGQKAPQENSIISILVVKVFIPSALLTPFISILVYYARCEVHYLGSLIQNCENYTLSGENKFHYRHNPSTNVIVKIIYYFLQSSTLCATTGSIFIYLGILLPLVSEGHSFIQVLRCKERSHKQNYFHIYFWYKLDKWIGMYRSVYLIIQHFNLTIGYFLLPYHFHVLLMLIVVGNYILIKLGLVSSGFFVAAIFFNVFCIVLLGIYKQGSIYYKLSQKALQSQKGKGRIWGKYLKSCSRISLEVGTLYKLTPSAIIRAISEVFTSLISALLLSNVKV